MEKTVEHLEALFQKAESNVNYLTRKLDVEFENTQNAQVNPAQMMQKISEVKKEYSSLVQEAAAIQQQQKAAVDEFKTQLTTTCQLLQKLQTGTGTMSEEEIEELVKLEELLGIELPPQFKRSAASQSGPSQTSPPLEATPPTKYDSDLSTTGEGDRNSTELAEPSVSSCTRRSQSDEFIALSREEFELVSELVRGRVKLSEVNQTYQVLWRHFKEEKHSKMLSSTDMYKLGLRVTGTTGQAKLKVLRSLKLLKISSKGEVILT